MRFFRDVREILTHLLLFVVSNYLNQPTLEPLFERTAGEMGNRRETGISGEADTCDPYPLDD